MHPNERAIRDYFDQVWNQRNEELLEEAARSEARARGLLDEGGRGVDLGGYLRFYRIMTTAFPDANIRILETMADDEGSVFTYFEIHMTHLGEFMGIPATGRRVRCECMAFTQFQGGKFYRTDTTWDLAKVLAVLGALDHLDGAEALAAG